MVQIFLPLRVENERWTGLLQTNLSHSERSLVPYVMILRVVIGSAEREDYKRRMSLTLKTTAQFELSLSFYPATH